MPHREPLWVGRKVGQVHFPGTPWCQPPRFPRSRRRHRRDDGRHGRGRSAGAGPGGSTARTIAQENALSGSPMSEWESSGTRRPSRVRRRLQRGARRRPCASRSDVLDELPDPHLPAWGGTRRHGARSGGRHARRVAAAEPARRRLPTRPASSTAATGRCRPPGPCRPTRCRASTTRCSNGSTGAGPTTLSSSSADPARPTSSSRPRIRPARRTTRYGGNSLYVGEPVGRAYKVSYNRPFNNGETESDFFNAEYALIRWLERNGYDVSYCGGIDVHRGPAVLQGTRSSSPRGTTSTRPRQQRANVEAARDAGVHLIFFSGNEVLLEGPLGALDRRLGDPGPHDGLLQGDARDAKIDPTPEWTGTWRDPRFSPPSDGGRPENALTGQLFRPSAGELADFVIRSGRVRAAPLLAQHPCRARRRGRSATWPRTRSATSSTWTPTTASGRRA